MEDHASHLAEVYQVLHPYLDPKTKSILRLVSKAVRVAVDQRVDKLVVNEHQLHKLGESAFQPFHLTIRASHGPHNWAGLQLAYVLQSLQTLVITRATLSTELCQALRGCLRTITRLELHGVQVDDPDILWSNATSLTHVVVYDMPLLSEAFAHLRCCPDLKGLRFAQTVPPSGGGPSAQIQDLIYLTHLDTLELQGLGDVGGNPADLTALSQVTRFAWRESSVHRDNLPTGYREALPFWLAAWPGLVHLDVGIELTRPLLEEILRALPQLQYLGCPQLTLAQKPGQPKVVMPHVRTLCVRSNLSLNTLGAVEAPQLEKLDGHPPLELELDARSEQDLQLLTEIAAVGLLANWSSIRITPSPEMQHEQQSAGPFAMIVSRAVSALQVQAIFTALSAWQPQAPDGVVKLMMPECHLDRAAMAKLPPAVTNVTFGYCVSMSQDALQPLASKTSLTSLDISRVLDTDSSALQAQVVSLAQAAPQGSRLCITVPKDTFTRRDLVMIQQMVAKDRQQAGLSGDVPQIKQRAVGLAQEFGLGEDWVGQEMLRLALMEIGDLPPGM